MSMKVRWSDSLELLADGLFDVWRKERSVFRRTCVVVHDMATRDWLKNHYLMDSGSREVLMNMDFMPLPEFVNNWLFAKTHDEPLASRNANIHPYAQPVLAWRIYRILSEEGLGGGFAPLREYVGDDPENAPRRRFELSTRLAKLYDDYLNSRFAMLCNWEEGIQTPNDGVPEWQRLLYRRLVEDDGRTYARDFRAALASDNSRRATDNGFPNYLSVHVFDVPDMPEPAFSMLEKISEEFDVTFWSFNPCGDWLADTPTEKSAVRRLCGDARRALREGRTPPPLDLNVIYDDPRERLLGTLATGARAVLGAQVDDNLVSPSDILGEPNAAFGRLEAMPVTIHSCYSPRRELEAVRNGLHDFFKRNRDAHPRDAIVLCGDWNAYAPIVESVFGADTHADGFIPIMVAGAVAGDTPLVRSFSDLLAFRENRFEASAVLSLLGVPSIRSRFGLDENGFDMAVEMVKGANIHWGLDDDDVNRTVGMENGKSNYPYTWRRGLDRMALDMLYGPLDNGEPLVKAGGLGEIMPCGSIEGDRAQCLKALERFVMELARLRGRMAKGQAHSADEWQSMLLETVGAFYEDEDENVDELKRIRQAIQSVRENAANARVTEAIDGDVFLEAVLASVRGSMQGTRMNADSVVFTSLKSASATPHRFVWICGLNDGKFPHIEYRQSFDAIGRHPSVFDVSSRDRDGFALLKAALSAGEELAISYVGKDIRGNDDIPPSVLLKDLTEFLGGKAHWYCHPLQSYSPRYFHGGDELPPNYSASDFTVAETLMSRGNEQEEAEQENISAFQLEQDGVTVIPAEELAEFHSGPNRFLVKRRLGLNEPWFEGVCDDDAQDVCIGRRLKSELMLDDRTEAEYRTLAKRLVEAGCAPDEKSAFETVANEGKGNDDWREYPLRFKGENRNCTCDGETVVGAFKRFMEDSVFSDECVECDVEGRMVRVPYRFRRISLETQDGPLDHVFFMEDASELYSSTLLRAWVLHVVGHAAGCSFATVMFSQKKKGTAKTFRPMAREEALEKLRGLLEIACNPLPQGYPDYERTRGGNDAPLIEAPSTVNTRK